MSLPEVHLRQPSLGVSDDRAADDAAKLVAIGQIVASLRGLPIPVAVGRWFTPFRSAMDRIERLLAAK